MAAKTPPPTHAPRPSISPLSTASKANKQSPMATRDAIMQDADLQEDIERNAAAAANGDVAGLDDEDGSSDLSDIDDDLDDETHGNGLADGLSDGEEATAHKSLEEVDSEAETERLDQTPKGQRKLIDTGRTPSKLSQAAAVAEDELSEPPSPLPVGPGAASSTSTVATAGHKRKRSGTEDSSLSSAASDLGESPRKRSHELKENEREHGNSNDVTEETELQGEEADAIADTPRGIEPAEPSAVPRKGPKGKKGKQKGRPPKEPVETAEIEQAEEQAEPETEPVEEDPAKTEEALRAKKEAMELFESVAKSHRAFQELLNRERLADVERQLEMLKEKETIHPEYRAQVGCVDARLVKQQSETRAFYRYKLRSIRERTLGERSQLHSQYFQQVRDLREDALEKLGEMAMAISNQRRLESIVPENDDAYMYKYNPKKSVQIRQQAKYNQEVSVLSGVAKYVGFPAAPDIKGVEGSAMEDDLKAMKVRTSVSGIVQQGPADKDQISKRAAQPTSHRPVYIPPANNSTLAQNERLAHEQFIEKNAWAQPQGPLHTLNTPNISHTPDWADQPFAGGAAKHLARNLSGQTPALQRTGSPYATPLPQKRTPLDFSSSGTVAMGNSDGPEIPPSSVIAAPPTSHRISLLNDQPPSTDGGPQTSPLTLPKQRQPYEPQNVPPPEHSREKELTGFRNISNLSNSTIDAPLRDTSTDINLNHSQHSTHSQPHHRIPHHDLPPGPHAHLYAHRDFSSPGHAHLTHLLRQEDSAPLQAFDTSAFHRHGEPHGPNGTPLRALSGFGSRTQTPSSVGRRNGGFPFVAGFRPGHESSGFGTPSATAGLGSGLGAAGGSGSGAIGPGPS